MSTSNLIVPTSEQAREYGRRGGQASAKKKKERKELREELIALLSAKGTQKKISVALIQKALDGDVRAFEVIRDTVGEKPAAKVNLTETTINVTIDDEPGEDG